MPPSHSRIDATPTKYELLISWTISAILSKTSLSRLYKQAAWKTLISSNIMQSTNLNWQWEDMPFLVASKHHPTQNWCGCSTAMIGYDRLPRDKWQQIGTIIILANFRGVQCPDHPQWHYPCPSGPSNPVEDSSKDGQHHDNRKNQTWRKGWKMAKVRPCVETPTYQGLQHYSHWMSLEGCMQK